MATFPTITDRNVETPSRVKLTEIENNVYDVVAMPGKVFEQGTPINADLFSNIETYIKTEDLKLNTKITNTQAQLTPVKTKVDETFDYIIAEGTAKGWNWIKFASGKAECIGTFSFTATQDSNWVGDGATLNRSTSITFPDYPFPFSENPSCTYSANIDSYSAWLSVGESSNKRSKPRSVFLVLPQWWGAPIGEIAIHVIGRWK